MFIICSEVTETRLPASTSSTTQLLSNLLVFPFRLHSSLLCFALIPCNSLSHSQSFILSCFWTTISRCILPRHLRVLPRGDDEGLYTLLFLVIKIMCWGAVILYFDWLKTEKGKVEKTWINLGGCEKMRILYIRTFSSRVFFYRPFLLPLRLPFHLLSFELTSLSSFPCSSLLFQSSHWLLT